LRKRPPPHAKDGEVDTLTLWYSLVAIMFALYAVLDGFDIGAGAIYLFAARTSDERRAILRSIGPVWDGNEVWLVAAGGILFFAFPGAYAAGFSGFYLPLIIVLWLLILRAIAIEFRDHIASLVWEPFWDVIFAGSSSLLAIFFGAALGNLMRGVPIDRNGMFFLALWTDFRTTGPVGILDWFTILVGISSLAALAMHGALWVALKTSGDLEDRARAIAGRLWIAAAAAAALMFVIVPAVMPHLSLRYDTHPWGFVFPLLAAAGLFGARALNRANRALYAFGCSSLYVAGMLASAMFGLYPYLLASNADPSVGVTIFNGATSPHALAVGLAWFIPGMILVAVYFAFAYRDLNEKVRMDGKGY
jgi:cytochrome bd ubiquinol oxidase subunit II